MSVFPKGDAAYLATYAEESAMIDAGELLARALENSGLSKAELARKLGVSRGEITSRLSGDRNITVRKLAATLHALGAALEMQCSFDDIEEEHDAVILTFAHRGHLAVSKSHYKPHGVDTHRPAVRTLDYLKAAAQ